jgi:glutamine synthetase
MMNRFNCKLEYLWLDGYDTPNIRSKTKYLTVETENTSLTMDDIPEWSFDGSSTQQADGGDSDCILVPVKCYKNPIEQAIGLNSFLVLCETYDRNRGVHPSNTREKLRNAVIEHGAEEMLFGIEQEYTMMDNSTGRPYGWPSNPREYPHPQGRYYCGVGGDVVTCRDLVSAHALACLEAGIPLCGTNAEVMLGQWEYQVGTAGPLDVCDDLWVARYLMEMMAEREVGMSISLAPKPIFGDWNGSGAHINFSTKYMRENVDREYLDSVCQALGEAHEYHITNYGIDNDRRLTGKHETAAIDSFSFGNSDRGASIRIPPSTAREGKGYLEDRRPASNIDPYRAVKCLVETVCSVPVAVSV